MAKLIPWRGKYAVDYRDAMGIRRRPSFETQQEAKRFLEDALRQERSRVGGVPMVDPNITVADYSKRFLTLAVLKPGTQRVYQNRFENHILPALGRMRVRSLHRGLVHEFLSRQVKAGKLKGTTISGLYITLRSMLTAAVDDHLLVANPALQLGRKLHLPAEHADRSENVRAMTVEQTAKLLATIKTSYYKTLMLVLARTGMRPGEALGLKVEDVDLNEGIIHIRRGVYRGLVQSPKTSHSIRDVEMSDDLAVALRKHLVRMKERAMAKGAQVPEYLFATRTGVPQWHCEVARQFRVHRDRAGLPKHLNLYSLRHSFASQHLQAGTDFRWVQRSLGHSTPQLTLNTYGKWLPREGKGTANRILPKEGTSE